MDQVQFDFAYMFFYSERPGTLAEKKYKDDVPERTKKSRLDEIIAKQREHSLHRNRTDIGKVHKVLVEGNSKRSDAFLQGTKYCQQGGCFSPGKISEGRIR